MSIFASLLDKTSSSVKKEASRKSVYDRFSEIERRINLKLTFGDIPVNYLISKDWEQVQQNCHGVILMREHYSNSTVKCVHNRWSKFAFISIHHHDDADQLLWINNGRLKIVLYDESGKEITSEVLLSYDENNQPYLIKAGVNHMLIAMEEETDFVTRFDIITK